ncbi:splicing factor, Prp19-binding domain-containing protein, partial [Mycena floridula]
LMSSVKKQAPRLARPAARYWKGKAPKGVVEADSDSDVEEEGVDEEAEGDVPVGGDQDIVDEDEDIPLRQEPSRVSKAMNIALKDVNISRDGKVTVAGREESGRTAAEDEESEEEESDQESAPGVEQKSSEYESDSEEEAKPKLQFRPVFVPKRSRITIQEKEAIAQDTEEAIKRKEEEAEERRRASHDLVAESIRRELAEKEKEEEVPDVDDTDGLDPPGEFEAWRLRELARIKQEKEAEIQREEEREEVERRRALPEEQRMKEDMERAQKLREEKPKGQQKFLQKYWHKGAFHQVCDFSQIYLEILTRHDFTEATESTIDVSMLPKVMQVKNFGKRSRTKYTHLLDQDTTATTGGFGGTASVQKGGKSLDGGGCFNCGGPHMKKGFFFAFLRCFLLSTMPKVAVVGSGLAGLTTAYLLSTLSSEFEVHLFEKSSTLGMDASSISLPVPGHDKEWRIDVPMRSFQGGYYPQLIALYRRLGVCFRTSDFSYSFSSLSPTSSTRRTSITASMIYNGNSARSGVSMPSSMKPPFNKSSGTFSKLYAYTLFALMTLQLLVCYLRLIVLSMPFRRPSSISKMKFREWRTLTTPTGLVARITRMDETWREFTGLVLIPLFSAVCTAPREDVDEHPVEELLDYIWLTLATHHYVCVNGVRDVVSRLILSTRHIHLSSPISSLEPDPDHPNLISIHSTGSGRMDGFAHVVFATQATRAVPLLESYLSSLPKDRQMQRDFVKDQINTLSQFTYTSTVVINHTDETLLPDNLEDQRDLNLIYLDPISNPSSKLDAEFDETRCVSSSYTMATHVLPHPEGFPRFLPKILQSTNPIIPPKESRILSVARLDRALLTMESKNVLKDLFVEKQKRWWQRGSKLDVGRLQGGLDGCPGLWICGAFAYPGIPLLEGCVVSARTIVETGILKRHGIIVKRPPW